MSDVLASLQQRVQAANSPDAEYQQLLGGLGGGESPAGGPQPAAGNQPNSATLTKTQQNRASQQGAPPPPVAPVASSEPQPVAPAMAKAALDPLINDPGLQQQLATPSPGSADANSQVQNQVTGVIKQGVGGALDLVNNVSNAVLDASDYVENLFAKMGVGPGDLINDKDHHTNFFSDLIPATTDPTGKMVRSVMHYVAPLAFGGGAAKVAGMATKLGTVGAGMAASVVTDFAAFDPHQQRLSNLIQDHTDLFGPVTEYLRSKPGETDLEGRVKNSIEGILVNGAVAGGFMSVLGAVKAAKMLAQGAGVAGEAAPAAEAVVKEAASTAKVLNPAEATQDLGAASAAGEATSLEQAGVKIEPGAQALEGKALPGADQVSPTAEQVLAKPIEPITDVAGVNLDKMGVSQETAQAMQAFVDQNKDALNSARRMNTPVSETLALADQLALTPEQIANWKPGQAMNAEEIASASNLLKTSSGNLVEAAKRVATEGTPEAQLAFQNAAEQHKMFYNVFSGARSESGRTQRILQEISTGAASKEQLSAMNDAIHLLGGGDNIMDTARAIIKIDENMGGNAEPALASVMNKVSLGQKIKDALYDVFVNSLLTPVSGAKVTAANVYTTSLALAERGTARGIGLTREALGGSDPGVAAGEVGAMAQGALAPLRQTYDLVSSEPRTYFLGKANAFMEGISMMAKGMREDPLGMLGKGAQAYADFGYPKPGDFASKMNELPNPGFSSKALGIDGNWGTALDMLGTTIRLPGKAISFSDQIFRGVHYRMQIYGFAQREAMERGLVGDEFQSFVNKFVAEPPPGIQSIAEKDAKEGVFANQLGDGAGKSFDDFIKTFGKEQIGVAPLRAIAPFVRTGINITEYTFNRTLGALLSSKFSADMAAGGARKDLATAKVGLGTAFLSSFALLAHSGHITGDGPAEANAQRTLKATGWQPQSIKIGDTYYSYRALSPLADMLRFSANVADTSGLAFSEQKDRTLGDMAMSGALLVGNTFSPEMLTSHFGDLLDAIHSKDPEDPATRRFISNLTASAIPMGGTLRFIKNEMDPTIRETHPDPGNWSVLHESLNKLRANIPGLSQTLPPQRNIFGEPVQYPTGLGPDIASPITYSKQDGAPISKELLRLGMDEHDAIPGEEHLALGLPNRTITQTRKVGDVTQTFRVPLNAQQYDKLVQLSAGIGLLGSNGKTLKDALNDLVANNYGMSKQMSDTEKRILIKGVVEKYRSAARNQFRLTDTDVQSQLNQQMQQNTNAIMGNQ